MKKKALVPAADGSEELETVAIVDILRRAGAEVTLAGVGGATLTGSKGIRLVADCLLDECAEESFDLIVLPGGMPGAEHLRDAGRLIALLTEQANKGWLYAALCASPAIVFYPHGLLRNRRFTCHPDFSSALSGAEASTEPVVVDGNLVTGRGAGTVVEFALTLVGLLYGAGKAGEVRAGMAI